MEIRWKKKDSALFSGMPRDGKCAHAKQGDLMDVVFYSIDIVGSVLKSDVASRNKEVEEHNAAVARIKDDIEEYMLAPELFDRELDTYVPYVSASRSPESMKEMLDDRIADDIDRALSGRDPFYIGQLPPVKTDTVFNYYSGGKLHFVGYNAEDFAVPGMNAARKDARLLHEYVAGPLHELKQFLGRGLLFAVVLFCYILALSLPLHSARGAIYEKIPQFSDAFVARMTTGEYFYDALIGLGIGAALLFGRSLLNGVCDDEDSTFFQLLAVGHLGFPVIFAGCLLRALLFSDFALFIMVFAGTLYVLLSALEVLRFLVRFFMRFNPRAFIPREYTPSFPGHASRAYRFCRLMSIWIEHGTGQTPPPRFEKYIRELDKLDKQFRRDIRRFSKLTGFPLREKKNRK